MVNTVALYFGGIFIHWHGIVMAVAALCTVLCAVLLQKSKGGSVKDIVLIALIGFIPSVIIGRVFYCYFMQESFTGFSQMLRFADGGTALYGFAAGYLLTIVIYCRRRRISIAQMLDIAAPAAAVGICIGRIASYFSGDDLGRAVANEKMQKLPYAVYSAETGEWNLAVFSFEAIAAFVVFAILIVFFTLKDSKALTIRDGDIALLFILLYGIPQTVFESMRSDSLFLISLGFVRISQIISILIATLSFVIFSIRSVKRGLSAFHFVVWGACLCCIGLAFWMEFCMTSVTAVRNYTIMCLCLAVYLFSGMAFYLDGCTPDESAEKLDGYYC